jgi:hypothetical protein
MYQHGYAVKANEYADFVDETTDFATNFFSHRQLKKPAFDSTIPTNTQMGKVQYWQQRTGGSRR